MRQLVLVAVVLGGLLLASCGKYGKPLRQAPSGEKRYTLVEPARS
jgi:outer membrane murein-binding lipoprotein Lpp